MVSVPDYGELILNTPTVGGAYATIVENVSVPDYGELILNFFATLDDLVSSLRFPSPITGN